MINYISWHKYKEIKNAEMAATLLCGGVIRTCHRTKPAEVQQMISKRNQRMVVFEHVLIGIATATCDTFQHVRFFVGVVWHLLASVC